MSGLVWDSSWAIEVPEHELTGSTLYPGKPCDFAGHPSLHKTTQYFESIAARELFEFQVSLFHKVEIIDSDCKPPPSEYRKPDFQRLRKGLEERAG